MGYMSLHSCLYLQSNHYGIVVNEVSGTGMDLTLIEEKVVTWVFEVTVEVYTRM